MDGFLTLRIGGAAELVQTVRMKGFWVLAAALPTTAKCVRKALQGGRMDPSVAPLTDAGMGNRPLVQGVHPRIALRRQCHSIAPAMDG